MQIWNNSYAFAYPCLATNVCTGEIGLSLEYGGNGNYENHVVGFWGDFVVYITTGSNVGTNRFGDYVTLRQKQGTNDNPGNLFDAFGYGLRNPVRATGRRPDRRALRQLRTPCQQLRFRSRLTPRTLARQAGRPTWSPGLVMSVQCPRAPRHQPARWRMV